MPDRSTAESAARSSRSATLRPRFVGLVDQHHGDAVADGVPVAALRADDDLLGLALHELAAAVRADEDLHQLLVDHDCSPPSPRMIPRTRSTFSWRSS